MKSIEEFKSFYDEQLLPRLKLLEEVRLLRTKKIKRIIALLSLAIALIIGLLFFKPFEIGVIVVFIIIILAVVFLLTGIYMSKIEALAYRTRFKKAIIAPIIGFISPELIYDPSKKISKKDFIMSRIFLQKFTDYDGDDFVVGLIDKTKFHFSELNVIRENNDRNNTRSTIFKGLFFIADFNKSFEGSTVLLPNRLGNRMIWLRKIKSVPRREKFVQLEDETFMKYYNCFSDDDIKARYILSPALMQRLVNFKQMNPKNNVYVSFVDSRINIAIGLGRDLFEPTYFQSLLDYANIKVYFEDIKFAVDIVEELNLNTRIWSKK